MATRTRWHRLDVDVDDSDPFADQAPLRPAKLKVPEVGRPIDLSGDQARLKERLSQTLSEEGDLDAIGINCSLKWDNAISCFACPLYQGDEEQAPMAKLCRLGREQETIVTHLAIAEHGDGR